ncbi:hypothetical protein [Mesorhizobium sp.]|jgi:hypothetical protein|uniref:hypothetical protein n=1 Tax=Mesorhizobium sp. TaxID=1871066 RepID=UPI00356377A0
MLDHTHRLSAFDSHVLRDAFKASVAELGLPETRWAEHAAAMLRDLTDHAPLESGIIEWIIRK